MSKDLPDRENQGTRITANYHIVEERPHRYYTEIPNIILDQYNLSLSAFRLYVHLKRVAADAGLCWQSQSTLAAACHLSLPVIRKAKRELESAGLIIIRDVPNQHGGRKHHEIAIVDIWQANVDYYASKGKILTLHKGKNLTPKNNPMEEKPRYLQDSEFHSESCALADNVESKVDSDVPEEVNVEQGKKSTRKPRQPAFPKAEMDRMVKALAQHVGPPPTNDAEWGKYRRAAKLLLQSGATPDAIPKLKSAAQSNGWPTQYITVMALATNYGILTRSSPSNAPPDYDWRRDPRGNEHVDISVDPRGMW